MPLFYFRPFDFHADKKPKAPPVVEFDRGDVAVLALVLIVALALFVAFVVVPMMTVLSEAMP